MIKVRLVIKFTVFLLILIAVTEKGSGALGAENVSPGINLSAAYQAAVQKTEPVPIQQSLTDQADESVSQAKSYLFPTVTGVVSYEALQPLPVTSAFTIPNQYFARFTVTQPIFHGLRDFAGLSGAKNQLLAQQRATDQARLSLYDTVAQAFYGVLSAEKDLMNLQILIDLTNKRVEELRARVKIGRSRVGEMLSAQAQVATLVAQKEGAQQTLDQARANFELATGLSADATLNDPGEELPEKPPSRDTYIQKIETRPDIASVKAQLAAAEDQVAYSWRGHLPALDFTGDYYLTRNGYLQGSNWDLGLVLTIPIFQGGAIQSQYRQAIDKRKQQELLLAQTRRAALHQIQNAYVIYTNSISQNTALKDALDISEKNYNTQTHDYRNGLVTNLDVLDALNTFQTTKQQLDRTYFQAKAAQATLAAATGDVPGI